MIYIVVVTASNLEKRSRKNGGILLVNPLQRSKSTFSWGSFLSFFAFKDGISDTQISALGGWPTVMHEPGLSTAYGNSGAISSRVSGGFLRQRARLKKPPDTPVSRWREIRACNDNACGASKGQNFHESLLDLRFLIVATDPKAPSY